VVVSGDRVTCIGQDGAERWSNLLAGEPAGRGILAEGFALCPTDRGIEAVRLQTGRFVGVGRPYASWEEWLSLQNDLREVVESGNLLLAEGKLIITTGDSVLVFDQRINPEETLIALQKEPENPDLHLHAQLASHYLWQEKYEKAADEYEAAYRLLQQKGGDDRLVDTIIGDLFTVYMDLGDAGVAGADYGKAIEYFGRALARAPHEDGRLQAQVRVAEAQAKLGNIRAAIDGLQKIITEHPDAHFHASPYLYVQARAYAEARISELLKQHGREHYAKHDAAARRAFESAGGGLDAARRVLQEYPNSSLVAPCLMQLAADAMKADDFRTAAGHLARLLRRAPGSPLAGKARSMLDECFRHERVGRRVDLADLGILPPLESRWSVRVNGGRNHAELVDLPAVVPEMRDVFYTILGKNIYCRRAADGTLVWSNAAGWLGVSLRDTPQNPGTEIVEVMPETPAMRAGLLPHDVIVGFDGVALADTADLIRVCGNTPAGRRVAVKVLRQGRELELHAVLDERPAEYDQMDRGYRAYPVGIGTVELANGASRAAFVLSRDRFLQALDPLTGEILKKFPISSQRFNPFGITDPTPRDGMGIVGNRTLLSLTQGLGAGVFIGRRDLLETPNEASLWDLSTGRQVWQRWLDFRPVSDPHIVGDVAVVIESDAASETYIACYAAATGRQLARHGPLQARGSPMEMIDLAGGRVCVAIGSDVFCYDVGADAQVWKRHVAGAELFAFELLPAGRTPGRELLLAATADAGVEVIDAASGRSLWSRAPLGGSMLQEVRADDERIYVCSRLLDRKRAVIEAFAIDTGRREWQVTTDDLPYTTALLVTNSHLAVGLSETDGAAIRPGGAKLLLLEKATGRTVQELDFKATTICDLRVVGGILIMVAQDRIVGLAPRRPRT